MKIWGGQKCIAGNIIVRQRGAKHNSRRNVGIGKDDTKPQENKLPIVIHRVFE